MSPVKLQAFEVLVLCTWGCSHSCRTGIRRAAMLSTLQGGNKLAKAHEGMVQMKLVIK